MARKMAGAPYHVESVRYKAATEKSEVPIAPSAFNKSITRCNRCINRYQEKTGQAVCLNFEIQKMGDTHCPGFVDAKDVINPVEYRRNAIACFYSNENHMYIQSMIKKIGSYRTGMSTYIDSLFTLKWAICGNDPTYRKDDIVSLIRSLKGEYWDSSLWNMQQSDIVINLGEKIAYKVKELKKFILSHQDNGDHSHIPRIIMFAEFKKMLDTINNELKLM